MQKPWYLACFLAAAPFSSACFAQLTTDQKLAEFLYVADSYANQYGPYEWKLQVENYDLLDLRPWVDRVRRTTNDIEYAETIVDYVSSLNDAHDNVSFPLNFSGNLGFTVDIYDGLALIDSINRQALPAASYPLQIGDELLSVDGESTADLIRKYRKYSIFANPRSTERSAAGRIVSRSQIVIPSLTSLPERSIIEIRRSSGDIETFEIPWIKTGSPRTTFGRGVTPGPRGARATGNSAAIYDDSLPAYMEPMRDLLTAYVAPEREGVLGFGARAPIFSPPAGFQQRLGRSSLDFFYSGTFQADGLRIGFIRIPSFNPPSAALALLQFEDEMIYFENNTDGLVIDDMRNPGGSVALVESIARLTHPRIFSTIGFEVRANAGWVYSSQAVLNGARASNQEPWIIANLERRLADVTQANSETRGRTGPISLNSTGGLELTPHPSAYTKPIVLLVDELSASGGDMFAAILQDNHRALLFGNRTMGAGGNVVSYQSGSYSEVGFTVTQSLMHRNQLVDAAPYPLSSYVENVGVRPDVVEDYMTRANLLTGGRPFVEAFTRAIVEHIRQSRQ
jgi:C-terminal processing protease CtpA/Prc